MKRFFSAVVGTFLVLGVGATQATESSSAVRTGVLFENVQIFDGTSERLVPASNVLVIGNSIVEISDAPIDVTPGLTVTRIAGEGRTLMPGLIDAHVHMMMANTSLGALMTAESNYVTLKAGKGATETLMRGFTWCAILADPALD